MSTERAAKLLAAQNRVISGFRLSGGNHFRAEITRKIQEDDVYLVNCICEIGRRHLARNKKEGVGFYTTYAGLGQRVFRDIVEGFTPYNIEGFYELMFLMAVPGHTGKSGASLKQLSEFLAMGGKLDYPIEFFVGNPDYQQ